MNGPNIDCSVIRKLLNILSEKTVSPWRHLFLTTNWDYLLQREVLKLGHLKQPEWSAETHVYHLNGTVEELADNSRRSLFILETDSSELRTSSTEANIAFTKISWNKTFVVVGMSFECEADKFLLSSFARIQDDLPIGDSEWIIVNPLASTLDITAKRVQAALPHSRVRQVQATFADWIEAQTPELQACGALRY